MAHEVDGAHFAYAVGESVPWHVTPGSIRDNPVPEALVYDVGACMAAAGMNLTHEKVPVQVDRLAADGLTRDHRTVPGLFAVRRIEDDKIISGVGVGTQYALLQIPDAWAFFAPFFESRACRFSCAGILKQGRRYFITARVEGSQAEVVPGDAVRGYLIFSTSIDGSLITSVAFSVIRVVCNNTLSALVADIENNVKTAEQSRRTHALRIRHTKNQIAALEAVRDVIDLQARSFSATVEQYRRLASLPLVGEDLKRYIRIAMEFPAEGELSTRAENTVDEVLQLVHAGPGARMAAGSAWAAYNGLTDYWSHSAGRSDDSRVSSILFEENSRRSAAALDAALSLAGGAR